MLSEKCVLEMYENPEKALMYEFINSIYNLKVLI